jgi:hypothetical protein
VREQRFQKFVENHELFCCHNNFDPADVRETIAEKGVPPSWWGRLTQEFEASEYQRKVSLSLKRNQAGRKRNRGRKTA